MSFLMKVISGPHAGAEVPIEGTLSIGSGESCDVMLADGSVSEEHLVLSLEDEKLFLESRNAEGTFLEGSPLENGDKQEAPLLKVIKIGNTEIVFGKTDSDWGQFRTRVMSVEEEVDADIDETEEGDVESEARQKVTPQVLLQAAKKRRKALGIASGILVLFLIYAAWPKAVYQNKQSPKEALQALLEKASPIRYTLSEKPLKVEAYTTSKKQAKELEQAIQTIARQAQVHIWSEEGILAEVKDVLETRKIPLKVYTLEKPGNLLLEGNIDPKEKSELEKILEEDIPGVEKVVFRSLSIMELLQSDPEIVDFTIKDEPELEVGIYVKNSKTIFPLQQKIKKAAPNLKFQIWSEDSLEEKAQSLVQSINPALKTRPGGKPGDIVIEGFIGDVTASQKLLATLKGIPGIRKVAVRDVSLTDILSKNKDLLSYNITESPELTINGYVETEKKVYPTKIALSKEIPEAQINIWSQNDILLKSRHLIQQMNLPLKIQTGDSAGTILVKGYIYDGNTATNLKEKLLKGVPGLKTVELDALSVLEILGENNYLLDYTISEGQNPTLNLYVSRNDEKYPLQLLLKKKAPHARVRIISQEQILSSVQDIAQSLNLPLNVLEGENPGDVRIEGYAFNTQNLGLLKQRLTQDVPGIRKIELKTTSPFDIRNKAYKILAKHGLGAIIQIHPTESLLVLIGKIDKNAAPKWVLAYKELEKAFENVLPIQSQVQILNQKMLKQNFFDSPIQSITIGGKGLSWVDLENGSRYFMGSMLPSGYILEKISPETILLRKGQQTVTLETENL